MTSSDQPSSETQPGGQEPQLGGRQGRRLSPQDRQRADHLFEAALDFIEDSHWEDAVASLHGTLALVPDYPQARGLLALAEEISRSHPPDPQQVNALQAYVWALIAAGTSPPPDPLPSTANNVDAPAAIARGSNLIGMRTPEALPPLEIQPLQQPSTPAAITTESLSSPAEGEMAQAAILSAWNPLDQWRLLQWLFFSPTRFAAYRALASEKEVASVGGGALGTLLLLPLLAATLGLGLAAGKPLSLLAWMPTLVVLVSWVLLGWASANDVPEIALVLAGSMTSILGFFTAGMLWTGMPVLLIAALALNAGTGIILVKADIDRAVGSTAAGVAIVPATVTLAFAVVQLRSLAFPLIAAGWGQQLAAAGSYLAASLPGIAAFGLSFGLVFGIIYVITLLPVFLVGLVLEVDTPKEGVLSMRVGVFAAIAALDVLLLLISLIRGIAVLAG